MNLQIFCFGEFEVYREGLRLSLKDLGPTKARSLLKVLLTQPNHLFTVDQLVESLWSRHLPENPHRTLQNYIYQLRKTLEPDVSNGEEFRLIRKGENSSYAFFANQGCWIDTQEFETHLQTAQKLIEHHGWKEAIEPLQRAMGLYRGVFLQEDIDEDWTNARRNELQEKYCHALDLLSQGYAQEKSWTKATECCKKAVALKPGHEGLRRQLMRYYWRAGYRDGIRETFQELEAYLKNLKDNLRRKPEPATISLYERTLKAPPGDDENEEIRDEPSTSPPSSAIAQRGRRIPWETVLGGLAVVGILIVLLILKSIIEPPPPPIQFFQNDAGPFKAAGGFPPVMVDFDELEPGTDLTGKTLNGVRFERSSPSSAPLVVARGWDTFTPGGYRCEPLGDPATHRLFPTTGANVLSPGGLELAPGPNAALEDDDLVLVFDEPVGAVGFDFLWQSADGAVRVITLQGKDEVPLFSREVRLNLGAPGVAPPSGSMFVGFVSATNNIAKVIVDEVDHDNCRENANAGYDTIYFKRISTEPPVVASYAYLRQWGGSVGTNPGQSNSDSGPRGIALLEESDATLAYVSDYVNHRIQEFDAEGRLLEQFHIAFPQPLQNDDPYAIQDIEYDGRGAFYARLVGKRDHAAGYVAKFDQQWNTLWAADAPAAEWVSYGLCVDSEGNIHVPVALSTAPADHKMYKYDPHGKLLAEYGAGLVKGGGNCEADAQGHVYAMDWTWSNLRRFTNAGALQDTVRFGYGISAIAVNRNTGDLFLAANLQEDGIKIRKFDSNFTLTAEWGGNGSGSGLFSHQVRDIEVDQHGRVYVNDGKNHLIQVFQPK